MKILKDDRSQKLVTDNNKELAIYDIESSVFYTKELSNDNETTRTLNFLNHLIWENGSLLSYSQVKSHSSYMV